MCNRKLYMGSKSQWKSVELKIARMFGSERSGPTGRNDADVKHETLAIEVKSRASIMSVPEKHLLQAERNAKGRIPMVVIHHDNCRYGREHVIMRLDDVINLLKEAGHLE
jgi:hypothetical protein